MAMDDWCIYLYTKLDNYFTSVTVVTSCFNVVLPFITAQRFFDKG